MSKIKSKKQFKEQADTAFETMKPPALVQVPRVAKPTRNQENPPYGEKREALL